MKYLFCAIFAMAAVSCAHYPTPYRSENGKVAYATIWGGKFMHTINADGSMAFTGDFEISLQHAFQMLTTLGLGWIDYLKEKVTELTAQLANANLTSLERARIQADLTKFTAQLRQAESLKTAGIGAGAPLGPINFQ